MNNTIAKKKAPQTSQAAKKLTPETVRKYLTKGNGNFSDQDILLFIALCEKQGIDPWQGDAYLIKYSRNASDPAQTVVGKNFYMKRADLFEDYDGIEAGIIVYGEEGKEIREGSHWDKDLETLVGGWCKVFRKDRKPHFVSVALEEYIGRKQDGSPNSMWASKPATMIRKTAISQALRECFPNRFAGTYEPEELSIPDADVPQSLPEPEKPESQQIEYNQVRQMEQASMQKAQKQPAPAFEEEGPFR
ncbi:MAG: phage recombination protein Bet [Veillonella sp.]|nr:phage recombination protein Bet [Veillonella sp.]